MRRVTVLLDQSEADALVKLAKSEYRDPRDQARFVLSAELKRRGLLTSSADSAQPAQPSAEPSGTPA